MNIERNETVFLKLLTNSEKRCIIFCVLCFRFLDKTVQVIIVLKRATEHSFAAVVKSADTKDLKFWET